MKNLNKLTFALEVLRHSYVLVLFCAKWNYFSVCKDISCGSIELIPNLKIFRYKFGISELENDGPIKEFLIRNSPTWLFFKNGDVLKKFIAPAYLARLPYIPPKDEVEALILNS